MRERFLFVDANNLLHRSFHGWKELHNSSGEKIGAIQGFLNGLAWVRTQIDIPLRNTIVFWDGGRAEGRLDLLPSYKANRDKKTKKEQADMADLYRQGEIVEQILTHAGVRQIKVWGTEADDLISIFALKMGGTGGTVVVFSGDHDFHQLIRPWIKVWDPKRSTIGVADLPTLWGTDNVKRIPQLKAIMGDKSDNIKGVPGFGPKRALQVIKYFDIPRQGSPLPRNELEPAPKDEKWLGKVLDHIEAVENYYSLICLPCNWEESFYNTDQAVSALTQWLTPGTKDQRAFEKTLYELELQGTIENLHRW